MCNGVRTEGFPSKNELQELGMMPSEERYMKGPVAIAECVQHIPCNPCASACPVGAIHIGEPITNLPEIDYEKCVGCGNCVAHCSGLAIFVINKALGNGKASVSFAYEYLPLPEKGQIVIAVDRTGTPVCEAEILRIVNSKTNDHTPVVTIQIPLEYADDVRSIQRLGHLQVNNVQTPLGFVPQPDDDVLVCRCEEVTRGEIRQAIAEGCITVASIKRRTHAGMGLCQGRTCSKIIARMLKEAKVCQAEPEPDTARFPLKPVEFGAFCEKTEQ